MSAFDPVRYARLDGYADDLLEVCDSIGTSGKIAFVGHSISCSIGILASIRRPDVFDRMIMIGPSPSFINDHPDYVGGFERQDLEDLLDLMDRNYIGWAQYLAPVVSGDAAGGTVSMVLADSFCSTDPVAMKVFAKATFFSDLRQNLARVPCPALILQNQRDALAPVEVGSYMHRTMPMSDLRVLDIAGHCAHMSHPDLIISAVRDYLSV